MATQEAQDTAAKQRIIQHMNADHHDSIRRYAEAYSSKSIFQARNATMTDVTLNAMTISCGGKHNIIPFDPPMKSFREARERLVQMDQDALQTLGRSNIPITGFVPPYTRFGHLCNFTICGLSYILLSRPSNSRPGSLIYDNFLYLVPAFAGFVAAVSPFVFAAMIVIHITEACLMARKLNKHGMTPFESLWWKWTGSNFIEGAPAFWRLNELLENNRKAKEARKH